MAVTIPASKASPEQLAAIRSALRQALLAAVERTTGQATIIRDIVSNDITGKAAANATFARLSNKNAITAQAAAEADWSVTLGINQAYGVYGWVALAPIPLIDFVQFAFGSAKTLAQFALAPIYADEVSAIGYFDPPVYWGPQQTFQMNLAAESAVASAAEPFHLLGYVAEPAGKTVEPDILQGGLTLV